MSKILDEHTRVGTGSWTQAQSSVPTYLKIVVPQGGLYGAKVDLITSETNGSGAGGRSVVEETLRETTSKVMPAGSYYMNGLVRKNPDGVPISIVAEAKQMS